MVTSYKYRNKLDFEINKFKISAKLFDKNDKENN